MNRVLNAVTKDDCSTRSMPAPPGVVMKAGGVAGMAPVEGRQCSAGGRAKRAASSERDRTPSFA